MFCRTEKRNNKGGKENKKGEKGRKKGKRKEKRIFLHMLKTKIQREIHRV